MSDTKEILVEHTAAIERKSVKGEPFKQANANILKFNCPHCNRLVGVAAAGPSHCGACLNPIDVTE